MKPKCSIERGRDAESVAHNHLLDHGLETVLRNHRCRFGELDLVMLDSGTLVIAEVRSRAATRFASAIESVDTHKRRKLVMATRHLLRSRPWLNAYPIRFDVIAIDAGTREITWIRNAFTL